MGIAHALQHQIDLGCAARGGKNVHDAAVLAALFHGGVEDAVAPGLLVKSFQIVRPDGDDDGLAVRLGKPGHAGLADDAVLVAGKGGHQRGGADNALTGQFHGLTGQLKPLFHDKLGHFAAYLHLSFLLVFGLI